LLSLWEQRDESTPTNELGGSMTATPAPTTSARRALPWLGFVGDLLQQPLTSMPHDLIIGLLRDTFDVTAVSYNWAEADGSLGIDIQPADTLAPRAEEFLAWQRGEFVGEHPLIAWHRTVGGLPPYTNERVPRGIVSDRARQPLIQMLEDVGCEHQLAINFRLGRSLYRNYVLARSGTDFSDLDLAVASQIQRVVIGLDRQIATYRRLTASNRGVAVDAGLTPRELCVLSLLSRGLSTQQIAHRLRCSPRTIHKHLERTYRKLGVRDRVNALRVADQWNLAGAPARPLATPTLTAADS
jgi:DNA-binding CsgD family transcriptional regulator